MYAPSKGWAPTLGLAIHAVWALIAALVGILALVLSRLKKNRSSLLNK